MSDGDAGAFGGSGNATSGEPSGEPAGNPGNSNGNNNGGDGGSHDAGGESAAAGAGGFGEMAAPYGVSVQNASHAQNHDAALTQPPDLAYSKGRTQKSSPRKPATHSYSLSGRQRILDLDEYFVSPAPRPTCHDANVTRRLARYLSLHV